MRHAPTTSLSIKTARIRRKSCLYFFSPLLSPTTSRRYYFPPPDDAEYLPPPPRTRLLHTDRRNAEERGGIRRGDAAVGILELVLTGIGVRRKVLQLVVADVEAVVLHAGGEMIDLSTLLLVWSR